MTTFHFDGPHKSTPCTLSGVVHYVHPDSRGRMKVALAEGCRCVHDGEYTASLVMRNGAPWLQCDTCGQSLGTAMPRSDHPSWQQYPHWRAELKAAFEAQQQAYYDARRAEIPPLLTAEQRAAAYVARAAEYETWLRTSPQWKAIKERILWRSRGHCEACLSGNAEVVHHVTYEFGKIPPAWHLRAVCNRCHERLHDGADDWCDVGMDRGD